MELIWAFSKMLEYLFIVPLWWVATYLAAFFYPLEGDSKQDFLALIFSCLIVIGMLFSCHHWLGTPDNSPQAAAENAAETQRLKELKATVKLLSPPMPTGSNP